MASPRISIKAWGGEELSKQFERLTWQMQREVLLPALKQGAYLVLAKARELVPVKTGALRRSLKVVRGKYRGRNFGYTVKTGTREELGIPREARYYYPSVVEYGGLVGARASTLWGAIVKKVTGMRGARYIPAHPFLRPAKAMCEERVTQILKQAVAEGCRRLMGKTQAREARAARRGR
jgi:HK97 gp10 family phage protein